jgi:hypothetical protein
MLYRKMPKEEESNLTVSFSQRDDFAGLHI